MKLKSIKSKILVGTGVCLMIFAIIQISFTSSAVKRNQILAAEAHAYAEAKLLGTEFQVFVEVALDSARTLAQILQANIKNNVSLTRNMVNGMLKSVLEENPDFVGIYTLWEPNAFDNKDSEYINQKGHDATGRFIPYWARNKNGVIDVEALVDYEKPGPGDYYQLPKKTKIETIIDPYFYKIQGKDTLITSLVVPIIVNDVFYGIAGVDMTLDYFQKKCNEFKLYGNAGETYIYSNSGKVAGAQNKPEILGKHIKVVHDDWEEDIEYVTEGKSLGEIDEGNYATFVPVRFGNTTTPWSVNINIPLGAITKEATALMWKQIFVGTILTFLALFLIWIVASKISKPVLTILHRTKDLAEGEADLTRRIEIKSNDELEELANWLNKFIERLQVLITDVKENSTALSSAVIQISGTTEELSTTMEHQTHQSSDVSNSIQELNTTSNEISLSMEKAQTYTEESSQLTLEGSKIIQNSIDALKLIDEHSENLKNTIGNLGHSTDKIGNIIDVINDVADQTNLLSLNAAIEAARAGEAGRGFAVVADEVRKLAERTGKATKEIEEIIMGLQKESSQAGEAMLKTSAEVKKGTELGEESLTILNKIVESGDIVKESSSSVAAAIAEENATITEVSDNIQKIATATEESLNAMSEVASTTDALAKQAENLKDLVDKFKTD